MWGQMEEHNTIYEVVGCVGVGVRCPELDSKPLDPIANLPIYREYSKQRIMLNDSTEMWSAKSWLWKPYKQGLANYARCLFL